MQNIYYDIVYNSEKLEQSKSSIMGELNILWPNHTVENHAATKKSGFGYVFVDTENHLKYDIKWKKPYYTTCGISFLKKHITMCIISFKII